MKKSTKILTGLVLGTLMASSTAFAAEEAVGEFTLDQIVVTAARTEKTDLETPAMVEVYTQERIEKTGGTAAYDVLENTLGINTQSQGFHGTAMATMVSKVMIRGVEKGALILVNGVPQNLDGKYNLENIPAEIIEKIEVVKGGGSVLYGSEATGGVINIITKKNVKNTVKVSAGNFGREKYSLSLGAKNFNVVAGLENRGHAANLSEVVGAASSTSTYYDYKKGESKNVMWNWQIVDGLTFTHNYDKYDNVYLQKYAIGGKKNLENTYYGEDNNFNLTYDKDNFKATINYGIQEKGADQATYDKKSGILGSKVFSSWRKGHQTDVDVQKTFDMGNNKLIVGVSYDREDMDTHNAASKRGEKAPERTFNLTRDTYSIYASYDWQMGDKDNLIINARETITDRTRGSMTNLENGKVTETKNASMKKFTPEIQYVHKLNENSTMYAKAGKSFRLPNLTQIFGTGNINPTLDLRPEQGTHYEIGYKAEVGKANYKVALFNYKIKDSIDAQVAWEGQDITEINYVNENVKNTGIEVSAAFEHNDNFSTNWGAVWQSPRVHNTESYPDGKYHDIFNRVQLNGGINYKEGKFASNLTGNFVDKRTSSKSSSAAARHLKPQMFTNLHMTYQPADNHKIFFHLNNIFDRKDITTNSTSNFLSLGRNFMLGYELTF